MVKISKDTVKGYLDKPVQYQLFKKESYSENLVVMLPGRGYTVQGPLFHYSTGVYLNKGYDVLHVNYDYTSKESDSMSLEEQISQISVDVNSVLDEVLQNLTYKNLLLIGKSIGTIALSSIVDRQEFSNSKIIWLTPLLHLDVVFEKMLSSVQPGLCIIGDKDPCYVPERFEELHSRGNMKNLLIPDTEHSLNYPDNPIDSIDVLKRVITEVSEF